MHLHNFEASNINIFLGYLRDVDTLYEQWANCPSNELLEGTNATKRNRAMTRIQQNLIAVQEIGDEKLNIVQQLNELIESKTRQLDQNFINLDYGKEESGIAEQLVKDQRSQSPSIPTNVSNNVFSNYSSSALSIGTINVTNVTVSSSSSNGNNNNADRGAKRVRRGRTDAVLADDEILTESIVKQELGKQTSSSAQSGTYNQKKITGTNANNAKKKRKKTGRQSNQGTNRDDTPPIEETIDPDEPTYCLCDQISFGEMILCDNDLCPIEWFHFSCVALMTKPKGKWFCPNCRGDRPNIMKPKAQFLKELERYNKEKEEKT